MTCANGFRSSYYQSYLSDWSTSCCGEDTIESRDLCWSKAQENVPGAVGIYWDIQLGKCSAIDDLTALGPLQFLYPDNQDRVRLCVWNKPAGI